jgi:hypothetical protein
MRTIHPILFAVVSLTNAAVAQFVPLTNSSTPHLDAKICPDASHVAFRDGASQLGIVDIAGPVERNLFTSTTSIVSSYVWAPDASGIYFTDGNQIRHVPTAGGTATLVAPALAGTDVRLWCIDPTGTSLYGTRRDAATNTAFLFRVPANGGSAPADLVSRTGTLDEVDIDETGSYVLLRRWNGTVPVPVTFERYDVAAGVALPMITINQRAESAHWITIGTHFVVAMASAAHPFAPQIARIAATGTIDFLVDEGGIAQRPYFPGTGEEVVFETDDPTVSGGTAIGMVPNHGGAVIMVPGTMPLFLNGTSTTGGLTVDPAITKIAISASTWVWQVPQIMVADIDETLHVHPRLTLGSQFLIDLDVPPGMIGAAALADGLTTSVPVMLPGIGGECWLDIAPGHMEIMLLGVAPATGGVVGSYTVPTLPAFQGLRVWVQGAVLDAALTGNFTHFGSLRVF